MRVLNLQTEKVEPPTMSDSTHLFGSIAINRERLPRS